MATNSNYQEMTMRTDELSKDELSNQELANVSGGVWAHEDEAPKETITIFIDS